MVRITKFVSLFLIVTLGTLSAAAGEKVTKVDLNTASIEELVELPRIGPKVAARVIKYREQNGGFQDVDELLHVRGIGEKTMDKLRDLVTVGEGMSAKLKASEEG